MTAAVAMAAFTGVANAATAYTSEQDAFDAVVATKDQRYLYLPTTFSNWQTPARAQSFYTTKHNADTDRVQRKQLLRQCNEFVSGQQGEGQNRNGGCLPGHSWGHGGRHAYTWLWRVEDNAGNFHYSAGNGGEGTSSPRDAAIDAAEAADTMALTHNLYQTTINGLWNPRQDVGIGPTNCATTVNGELVKRGIVGYQILGECNSGSRILGKQISGTTNPISSAFWAWPTSVKTQPYCHIPGLGDVAEQVCASQDKVKPLSYNGPDAYVRITESNGRYYYNAYHLNGNTASNTTHSKDNANLVITDNIQQVIGAALINGGGFRVGYNIQIDDRTNKHGAGVLPQNYTITANTPIYRNNSIVD